MNSVTNIYEVFRKYNGDTWLFPLFLAALAYLFWKMDGDNRRNILLTILSACIFVFNQAAFWVSGKIEGIETYYRFLWMIPVIPILAYVLIDLVVMQKKRYRKVLVLAAAGILIFLAGTPRLEADSFRKPTQISYLHRYAETICNVISEDKELPFVWVACDMQLAMSLRLQDPTIKVAILRSTYKGDPVSKRKSARRRRQRLLLRLVSGGELTAKQIRRLLNKTKVRYVIMETAYDKDERMLAAGCSILETAGNYTIYRFSPAK